jgi:hypothetical protein
LREIRRVLCGTGFGVSSLAAVKCFVVVVRTILFVRVKHTVWLGGRLFGAVVGCFTECRE